jgi:hypothetical protein
MLLAPQVTKVQAVAVAVAADLRTSAGIAAQIKAAVGAPPPGVPGQPSIGDVIEQDAGGKGKFLHAVTKRVPHHKFQKKPVPFLEGTDCSGLDGLNWQLALGPRCSPGRLEGHGPDCPCLQP